MQGGALEDASGGGFAEIRFTRGDGGELGGNEAAVEGHQSERGQDFEQDVA